MTMSMERRLVTSPGRLQSKPAARERAHPLCTLQHIDDDDLEQTMCDALTDEEKRLRECDDAVTFQLQRQFIRAHGLPRGEVTTLSPGGIFHSPPHGGE